MFQLMVFGVKFNRWGRSRRMQNTRY